MLPAFPAAALLMALWMHDCEARALSWLRNGALLLAVVVIIGAGIGLNHQWPGTWVYALCFAPLLLAALLARKNTTRTSAVLVAGGMAVSVSLLAAFALPMLDRMKAAPALAIAADKAGFDGSELATYRYFQPSLLFYHGGRLPMLDDMHKVAGWLMQGKAVVLPESALADFPDSILPWLVVHDRRYGMYARTQLILISLKQVGLRQGSLTPAAKEAL